MIFVKNLIKTQGKTFVEHIWLKMPPKKKRKLTESPEINLIWTDDEVQLLLESVRNFKTQEVCGSTTLFDPATSLLFVRQISLFLSQI